MSFSISTNFQDITTILNSTISDTLASDLDINNFGGVNVNNVQLNMNDGSLITSPTGVLSLYANNDGSLHLVNDVGGDTTIGGDTYDQPLNTGDSVDFIEVSIDTADASGARLEFNDPFEWSVGNNASDNFVIENSAGTAIEFQPGGTATATVNIAASSVLSENINSLTQLDIGTGTATSISIGDISRPNVINTDIVSEDKTTIGSTSDATLESKSIRQTFIGGESIAAFTIVELNAVGKAVAFIAGGDDNSQFIGISAESGTLDTPFEAITVGIFRVILEDTVSVSVGSPLRLSTTANGRAALGVAESTIFGIATSAGTGDAGGTVSVSGIFTK